VVNLNGYKIIEEFFDLPLKYIEIFDITFIVQRIHVAIFLHFTNTGYCGNILTL